MEIQMPLSSEQLAELYVFTAAAAVDARENSEHAGPYGTADAGVLRGRFLEATPQSGLNAQAVISSLVENSRDGHLGTTGKDFFGWVIGGSNPVGVAADWLTSNWGQAAGLFETAPAASIIEEVAAEWLKDILHLPEQFSVGFVTGATVANIVGISAGRSEVLRKAGWDFEEQGFYGSPKINIVVGAQAHTTVFHALRFLGFGTATIVRIPTDKEGRMGVTELRSECSELEGPTIIIAQAGHVNTGAIDDIKAITAFAQTIGAWVHVDGAFGAWARASDNHRWQTDGLDQVDSFATDGHKWLQTPYDTGFVFIKNEAAHRRAMNISASYLPAQTDGTRDPSHFVPELSRRARGVPVWANIKAMGKHGIAKLIDRHCELAQIIRQDLEETPGIHIVNQVSLNQLLVRFGDNADDAHDSDAARAVLLRMKEQNKSFVGGTDWNGCWVMRISVISERIDEMSAKKLIENIKEAWSLVRSPTRS